MSNMKKLTIIALSLMLLSGSVIIGQDLSMIDQYMIKLRNDNMGNTNTGEDKSIDGTPYMTREFAKGEILTNHGTVFQGDYRFNIHKNQIEFRKDGQILSLTAPNLISKVVIGEHTFKYYSYRDAEEIKNGYFIVLEEGQFTLLEQRTKLFFDKIPAKPYQEATPARYIDGKDFFWMKVGDNPAEIILKPKDIPAICGEHGALAKQFIDREKLKFKDRSDYIRLAEYLNGAVK
jgi:hypothetical protein